jgi:tripartite-type tricarboxylate transporter receptor subunit TctC
MKTLIFLAAAVFSMSVQAQSYPVKPVRIVLPFAAGGVADIVTRTVAQKISEPLGQQVVVENRPSAGGIVAAEAVKGAAPDGYTLLLLSNGTAVSVSLFKSLPFDPVKDFAPISMMGTFDMLLIVPASSPYNSVKELVAAAKAFPNKLAIGTITAGSTQHLAMELFVSLAGVNMQAIPYKTTPEVFTALRAGDLQAGIDFIAPIMGQIKGGTVKTLGVTGDRRFPGLKDIPTIAEAGVPGYQTNSWNGLGAPANTPRAIIDRLNKEVVAAAAATDVKDKLLGLGVETRSSTPEELGKLLVAEIAKWAQVIERAKIPKQ